MDLKLALQRMGGDRELLVMLLRVFLDDAPPLVQEIESSAAAGHWTQAQKAAHRLRGIAANLDATAVMSAASAIEGKPLGTPAEVRAALESLRSALEQTLVEVRQEIG